MSDKPASKPSEVNAAAPKTTERWISLAFAEHSVICKIDGKPEQVKFKDYSLDLDLTKPEDVKISKALRESSRFKRDIVVVGEAYPSNGMSEKSAMLDRLRSMTVPQLRSLFNLDEILKAGFAPATADANDLITLAMATKSI